MNKFLAFALVLALLAIGFNSYGYFFREVIPLVLILASLFAIIGLFVSPTRSGPVQ